jgi:hypothetical protein
MAPDSFGLTWSSKPRGTGGNREQLGIFTAVGTELNIAATSSTRHIQFLQPFLELCVATSNYGDLFRIS